MSFSNVIELIIAQGLLKLTLRQRCFVHVRFECEDLVEEADNVANR